MFKKILIANRGEIACRVIRTAKSMGIQCVAIYSEADTHAPHVALADEAFCVGPAPAQDSYLNIKKIIEIAKQNQVEAIHPGYGFLSENSAFAEACHQAKIIFIGPSVKAIQLMGSKSEAKKHLEPLGIPLTPGYHGDDQSLTHLKKMATKIGYPILIKAAAGGGGKGMKVVSDPKQLDETLASAKREALSSFGDDKILLEKYLHHPRHIEIQVFADQHGNTIHLFERDCSIQRRHQKIIEEATAPKLSTQLREKMGKTAVKIAQSIHYVGAGTIEFLLDEKNHFYFMEMNTRLQVEHPVTEMITGLDLVEWQLKVAAGEPLPSSQKQIKHHGHAIEVRIYAEDPQNHFLPSIGKIYHLKLPELSPHIRVDSGVTNNSEISMYYDPMIAKLIAYGDTRETAIQYLQQALREYQIAGVKTNISFLQNIIALPAFMNEHIYTNFIEENQEDLLPWTTPLSNTLLALFVLYVLCQQSQRKTKTDALSPWNSHNAWRLNLPGTQKLHFIYHDKIISIPIEHHDETFTIIFPNEKITATAILHQEHELEAYIHQEKITATIVSHKNSLTLFMQGEQFEIKLEDPESEYDRLTESKGHLSAPMPGTVVAVMKKAGDSVEAGDGLVVIEAMKMEHTIRAPAAGIVKEILYNVGDRVQEGCELLAFEASV
ncbi:MAG: acetyl/propionyl/methylcrotonyl-CoA carboxylase subunit alpha [Proteobacteria bacterium]|nr:acetyl/propionyl/methylcrotonyl-CoA carboxylase subunit alpha [Pseudomonadota bacterium]